MGTHRLQRVSAVGRLPRHEAWVGFAQVGDGYRLVFGSANGPVAAAIGGDRRADLLAAAFAYFADELDDPPPEVEATQADVGDLLRWLAGTEPDATLAGLLGEAVDAVDDGLAPDAVLMRLGAAYRAGRTDEPADPVDRLTARYGAFSEDR